MIALHIAVFFFGIAGLFGKLLSLSPIAIVLGRASIASAALAAILIGTRRAGELTVRRTLSSIPSGLLLAAHWITFFQSIQVSTVAIGLLSFSTFPVFVAFLDPLLSKTKLAIADVASAILVFGGLALVVPEYDFGNAAVKGALWGLASGFTFALLTIWNRAVVANIDPIVVGLLQNFWAALVLAPFASSLLNATKGDWALLLLLGVFCTALAHWLFIGSLRSVRAQIASVTAGLEPVYGILIAALLLDETPSFRELAGGAVIIAVVTAGRSWSAGMRTLRAQCLDRRIRCTFAIRPTTS